MQNAEVLHIPTRVEVVPKPVVDALLKRLQDRMEELRQEGWKPSSGWASDDLINEDKS